MGWVGDGASLTTVIGGPLRNFVKVTGPAGSDLDGKKNNFVQSTLFVVSGRKVAGALTTLAADRVTYTTAGQAIDIFGTTNAAAEVTVSGAGVVALPGGTLVATATANGKFYKRVAYTPTLPTTVTLSVAAAVTFLANTISPPPCRCVVYHSGRLGRRLVDSGRHLQPHLGSRARPHRV